MTDSISASEAFLGISGGGHRIFTQSVRVAAGDSKQISFDVYRETTAQFLGNKPSGTFAQQQFLAGRNYDGFDIAFERKRFVGMTEHLGCYSVVTGAS